MLDFYQVNIIRVTDAHLGTTCNVCWIVDLDVWSNACSLLR